MSERVARIASSEDVRQRLAASWRLCALDIEPWAAGNQEMRVREHVRELNAFRHVAVDMRRTSHPPLAAVADLMRCVFGGALVRPRGGGGAYWAHVVAPWWLNDAIVARLRRAARARGPQATGVFVRLLARHFAARAEKLAPSGVCYAPVVWPEVGDLVDMSVCGAAVEAEMRLLESFAARWPPRTPPVGEASVLMLEHIERESDEQPLAEVAGVWAMLRHPPPVCAPDAVRLRYTREDDADAPPRAGGLRGIRWTGELDDASLIVPHALALIEDGREPDLFDVELAEGRVPCFRRARVVEWRPRHRVVFDFPRVDALEEVPARLPTRWVYLVLAAIFDAAERTARLMDARRTELAFSFARGGEGEQGCAQLDRLVELVARYRRGRHPLRVRVARTAAQRRELFAAPAPGQPMAAPRRVVIEASSRRSDDALDDGVRLVCTPGEDCDAVVFEVWRGGRVSARAKVACAHPGDTPKLVTAVRDAIAGVLGGVRNPIEPNRSGRRRAVMAAR